MAVQNINLSFTVWIAWRERNDNKYKEKQRDKAVIYIPRYNLLLFCIPNLNFLSYKVVEISLTKNVERKKK